MFKLARYLKLYEKEVIIGPIVKLTEAVFELIVPMVMARIIDIGIKNADKSYILKMGLVLLMLGFFGLCFALICQYFASKASQGIGTALRNDLFRHINTLSASEIDKIGASSLITRINSDVNQLQLSVAMLIRLAVRAPFLVIGSTAAAMMIDLKLSVIFLITAPLLALVLYLIMKYSVPFYKTIQKKLDKVSLITKENLSGARVIRAFSKQEYEEKRFEKAANDLSETSMAVGRISALLSPLTFIIMNTAIIFIIWFGGKRVYIGDFTQGEVIAFINYITQIMLAMVVLANIIVIFTKASASAVRVNEIFDLKPAVLEKTNEFIETDETAPVIEFQNVGFSYNKDSHAVLENISFAVIKGERIGIIGGTGSGKTSVINLIPRFYDANSGNVLVKGVNVKEYSFKQLRHIIGIVPQKSVMFSGSLRDNLKLADKTIPDSRLYEALEISQAKEFTDKLENGLDTFIERGGENLSGGQKQRLAIARAVAPDPEILILDDSSSALDFRTEANLRASLNTKMKNSTVIITTQRVSCVMHCDRIIVIDDGKIVGIGNHGNLKENCAIYKEICASQLKEEEVK